MRSFRPSTKTKRPTAKKGLIQRNPGHIEMITLHTTSKAYRLKLNPAKFFQVRFGRLWNQVQRPVRLTIAFSPVCLILMAIAAGLLLPTTCVLAQEVSANPANDSILPESQLLWNQAKQFQTDGRHPDAVKALQKLLELERKNGRIANPQTSFVFEFLAQMLEGVGDYAGAKDAWKETLEIRTTEFGADDWRTLDARQAATNAEVMLALTSEQQTQLERANGFNRSWRVLHAQGKFAEAIEPCLQTLSLRQSVYGEAHFLTASSTQNLALVYSKAADYATAEKLYEQSLEIHASAVGEIHPDTASIQNNLALLYVQIGAYSKAEPLLLKCLEIRRRTLGDQHADTATTLNSLGGLYEETGHPEKAEPLFRQALEIWQTSLGEQHPLTATAFSNLADACKSQGDYAQSEMLMRKGLAIRTSILGELHPDTALSYTNLAELLDLQGNYAQAETIYQTGLRIQSQVLGDDHPELANTQHNLAGMYSTLGDHAKAAQLLRQCLVIRQNVLGEDHPDTANTMNSLASLYMEIGDFENAEILYQQCLANAKRSVGTSHPLVATCLGNMGVFYQARKDFAKAEQLMRQSLEMQQATLGDKHRSIANSFNNLAVLHVLTGDYAQAEPEYLRCIEIQREVLGAEHPETVRSLSNLAAMYQLQKKFAEAETLLQTALEATRASLDDTAIVQSERQQLVMSQTLRYQLDNYVSLAVASRQFDDAAFRQVLAWKGATLVRQRQMHTIADQEDVATLFAQLQQVTMQLATLSRLGTETEEQEDWRSRMTELSAQKERLQAELSLQSAEFRAAQKDVRLEDLLTSLPKNSALVDFLEYRRLVPSQTKPPRAELIPSLVAFVVQPGQPIALLDLGPSAPVSEAIDTWRTTFGSSRDGATAGRFLRESIWQPIEKQLKGIDLVLVSVDGALGRLPLAALPGRKPGTFLLEDYRLAMLPVPQLLPALVNSLGRRELSGGLLLLGDVNYEADADPIPVKPTQKSWKRSSVSTVRGAAQFPALAATAGEIASIKTLFTDLFHPAPDAVQTLKQAGATEQQFRDQAPKFYNLHLATHGFFAAAEKDSGQPVHGDRNETTWLPSERDSVIRGSNPGLLSGLAFSGANREPDVDKDDGILTADEIASLSLNGVDLVVLSACETGLGEVAGGEGLLGVQRAFQVAGARSTVASLWQVDDVATRRLMERFYRNYWEKEMSKLDAIREAQLYLLNNPEAVRGDARLQPGKQNETDRLSPQFWAAFSLSGDWR